MAMTEAFLSFRDIYAMLMAWHLPESQGLFGLFSGLLIGAILGSFVSMASWRWPREESWLPPSRCTCCGKRLSALALIPLISWLIYKGRSNCCGHKISIRYPLLEVIAALMIGIVGYRFGISVEALLMTILATTLLLIAQIDLETGLIPDGANLTVGLVGLLWISHHPFSTFDLIMSALQALAVGFGLAWGYSRLRGKDMMGWGDVKFMIAAAPWLKADLMPIFLFISGFLGLAFGVYWLKSGKGEAFPFAPALVVSLATLIYWQVF